MKPTSPSAPGRRAFLKGALGVAALGLLGRGRPARAADEHPRFFLHLVAQGGLDATYAFDARPRALTAAGLRADYLGEEPTVWTGRNGASTLVTSLVAPLAAHRDRFSILNGVVMSAGFDGHRQNTNFMFTGSPFGGESFLPWLSAAAAAPLAFVQSGALPLDTTNSGDALTIEAGTLSALCARLRATPPMAPGEPISQFVRSRMRAASAGRGRFSAGAAALERSLGDAVSLSRALRELPATTPGGEEDPLETMVTMFRAGITTAGVVSIGPARDSLDLDAHTPERARRSPESVGYTLRRAADAFRILSAAPFDATRSMLDVTTVLVSSEFSRTLRQADRPLDATGTDHNPLTGTVLLGGCGVRAGLVVGASDLQSADETLSGVHRFYDPGRFKPMGRPFDARTLATVSALPEAYAAEDYLSMPMIANTLFSLFGVRGASWRLERSGPVAPVLSGLLG